MSTSATASTEVQGEHQRSAVAQFAAGWKDPHPHAWDDLLAPDVELHQPLMPDGTGAEHWRRELAHLLEFLPDLRGEVVSWTAAGETIHIDIRCSATAGGRPIAFQAVDRLTLDDDGKLIRRDSYFDPGPVIAALARRPSVWPAWWNSGAAPLTRRRGLLRRAHNHGVPRAGALLSQRLVLVLGLIRAGVGLTATASPRLAYRSLGARFDPAPAGAFAARAFGARDFGIALATLSPKPATSRIGVRLGVLADALDTASILAARRGGITNGATTLIGGATAGFTIAGVVSLMAHAPTDTSVPQGQR